MSETEAVDIKLKDEQVQPLADALHGELVTFVEGLKSTRPFKNGGLNGYTHFPSDRDQDSFIATTRVVDDRTDTIAITMRYPNPSDLSSHIGEKLVVTKGRKPSITHTTWDTHIAGNDSRIGDETTLSNHPAVTDKATDFKAKASTFGKAW